MKKLSFTLLIMMLLIGLVEAQAQRPQRQQTQHQRGSLRQQVNSRQKLNYDDFVKETNRKYEAFRDSVNKKYAAFMEKAWKDFDIEKAVDHPKEDDIKPIEYDKNQDEDYLEELRQQEEEQKLAEEQQKREAEQKKLLEEQKKHEEEQARLAAEKKKQEEELARLAAEKKKQEEELARLAAEKKKQEDILAKLAAEKKKQEEKQAQLAAKKKQQEEEQARLAAEKKAREEEQARLAAEKKAQQEEKARIAAEKKKQEEEQAKLLAEKKKQEQELKRLADLKKKQEEQQKELEKQQKKAELAKLLAEKKKQEEQERQALAKQKEQERQQQLLAEKQRKQEEQARLLEEKQKKQEEKARLLEEKRKQQEEKARLLSEQKRQQEEEQARLAAEKKKQEEEQARIAAEKKKQEEEQARIAAEKKKQEEEQARIAAEKKKQEEQARLLAEKKRQQEEKTRLLAEKKKQQEEKARQLAEQKKKQIEKKSKPIEAVVVPVVVEVKPQPKPQQPIVENDEATATSSFEFYGTPMKVRWGNAKQFKLKGTGKKELSNAFLELTAKGYNNLVHDCLELRKEYKLCDWAYYKMLQKISEEACGKGTNEAVFMQGVLMNQSGYQIRFALEEGNKMHLMTSMDGFPYDRNYLISDGKIFHLMDGCKAKTLTVCDAAFPGEQKMGLGIAEQPELKKNLGEQRTVISRFVNVKADMQLNKNLIDFYNDYPTSYDGKDMMTRWAYYANTPVAPEISEKVYPQLKQQLGSLPKLRAANMLLNWVQMGLTYGYDDKVWGHDRAFFAEETLFYPFCDCEDRAILYTHLVRDLLALDAVLVYYPGHLYTAVCFNNEEVAGDYIMVNGRKFTVADPTYYNANVGKTMSKMDNSKAKVILLKR